MCVWRLTRSHHDEPYVKACREDMRGGIINIIIITHTHIDIFKYVYTHICIYMYTYLGLAGGGEGGLLVSWVCVKA